MSARVISSSFADLARLVDHLLVGERVGEPVVGHRVDRLHVAHAEAEAGAGQQVGSVRHRLHPAGDADLEVAGADRLVGEPDRAHARGADLVDVSEGTSFGIPASICAWREGIWPWPACSTWPKITCWTWSAPTSARSSAASIASPPSSGAPLEASAPPIFPNGVRAVPRMTVWDIEAFLRSDWGRRRPRRTDSMLVKGSTRGARPPSIDSPAVQLEVTSTAARRGGRRPRRRRAGRGRRAARRARRRPPAPATRRPASRSSPSLHPEPPARALVVGLGKPRRARRRAPAGRRRARGEAGRRLRSDLDRLGRPRRRRHRRARRGAGRGHGPRRLPLRPLPLPRRRRRRRRPSSSAWCWSPPTPIARRPRPRRPRPGRRRGGQPRPRRCRTCPRTSSPPRRSPPAPRRSPRPHEAVEVEVLDREAIAAAGMGGLIAVSQGAGPSRA